MFLRRVSRWVVPRVNLPQSRPQFVILSTQSTRQFQTAPVLFKQRTSSKRAKQRAEAKTFQDEEADEVTLDLEKEDHLEKASQALEESLLKVVEYLKKELTTVKSRRANPEILNNLKVELPEQDAGFVRFKDVAQVSLKDARTLLVTTFNPDHLKHVQRAILSDNSNFNPQPNPKNPELQLFIPLPPPTRETRVEAANKTTKLGENAKAAARNARQDGMKSIKAAKEIDKSISKDEAYEAEKAMDKQVKKCLEEVDKMVDVTKKSIMAD